MGSLETWHELLLYSRAGSTRYVVNRSSEERTIRPSWWNTSREGSVPVNVRTWRPRSASQIRRRPSRLVLASSLPAGWKVACSPATELPSSWALRKPDATSQRSSFEVPPVARVARRPGPRRPTPDYRSRELSGHNSGPTQLREYGIPSTSGHHSLRRSGGHRRETPGLVSCLLGRTGGGEDLQSPGQRSGRRPLG